ncbi:hypothetical protein MA6G0125R_3553 [Mycobacteroides abscessus 6G-0125-R]|nr:hypothetical protein MA6G0125R_3553 [Mycobacteroides abscessus 6G-0125-R]SKU56771.1 Uncharacterised protein [Mycobacteroides abscessus subsp. abscessus]
MKRANRQIVQHLEQRIHGYLRDRPLIQISAGRAIAPAKARLVG